MDLKLTDKVVVITGPAKGMGAAITRAFAEEGCRLSLIGRDTGAIEPIAKELEARGSSVVVIGCDLTDAGQCDAAAARTLEAFGRID
ncbi:MAG: SDR family NAD(P)-dependent oxidoreductase, partial [Zymomonas sp.]